MKVVIISGPTASGKTQTAIDLATQWGGEIVNFDSLLLYREITIGTAKPSLSERSRVPHHMIDVRSISDPMNAADYAASALEIVNTLHDKGKTVYLVGGSGFYLQALLKGMYASPTTPKEILDRSEDLYRREGIRPFLEVLKLHDPASLSRYHENDHYRVRRAVEHWWANKTPFSAERAQKDKSNQGLESATIHNWDVLHIYLDLPKEEHLEIIKKRTEKMLKDGLYEEVKDLLARGHTGLEKPLQSIGYKEILDLHFGVLKNLEECKERIIISTRQLAKAQRTWFKKDPYKKQFHPLDQRQELFDQVEKFFLP